MVCNTLVVAKLCGSCVEPRAREGDDHRRGAGVFPVPSVNAGEGRDERAGFVIALLLGVALKCIATRAVGVPMEFVLQRPAGLPRIQHAGPFLEPVLVLESVLG